MRNFKIVRLEERILLDAALAHDVSVVAVTTAAASPSETQTSSSDSNTESQSHGKDSNQQNQSNSDPSDNNENTSNNSNQKSTSTSESLILNLGAFSQNDDPVGVDDNYTVGGNSSLTVNALNGVLANDSGSGPLSTLLLSSQGVSHGTLLLNPDGSFTYTPNPGFTGSQTFNYKVVDQYGETSNPTRITFNVVSVNDAPSFNLGPDQLVYEDAAAQTIANFATNISAGPPDESSQTVQFYVSNDNISLFSVQPYIDSNGTLQYTLAPNQYGTAIVSVYLQDNGGTANGGDNTSDVQQFTIEAKPVNDVPSFTVGPDQFVPEDAGAQTVANFATNISAGPSNESSQIIHFHVYNSDNSLFSVQPYIDPDGTLHYTVAPNKIGSAVVSVDIQDDGGTANGGIDNSGVQQFTIQINSINDAPSFTIGPNQTVFEDAGAQTVNDFATNISSGPSDESSQTLQFYVSNDNSSLFSVQPYIDQWGNLKYTLAPNQNGSALVSVYLKDSGGTANGGDDKSDVQQFTILAKPVNDAPSFTIGPDQKVLEDAGAQTIANFATNISAGPPDESSQTVQFIVSNDNNSLFSVQPYLDPDGTLHYTLAPNQNGSAIVSVYLQDSGGTSKGGDNTSDVQKFTIEACPVNDAPSFTVGPDQKVLEDAGSQTVANFATNIAAGPSNESSQNVQFIVSNDNNSLFSVQPYLDADGTLHYTLAPNQNGSAIVSVYIQDNGGTANEGNNASAVQQFTIQAASVNDAPSFTLGPNQPVLEDAAPQTISNFASNINAGPSNESSQTVQFHVSNDNNSLFSVQPYLDPDGTLHYTLAPDQNGTAIVSVYVSDSGGTANGGVDASAVQQFTIQAASVNDAPSFVVGPNQTVSESFVAQPQTVPGFATNISSGPPNESGQTVNFIVNNNNPGLFSVQPTIDSSGNLIYTLAPGQSGTAIVSVQIQDNGGTANGGSSLSGPQTFVIQVNQVFTNPPAPLPPIDNSNNPERGSPSGGIPFAFNIDLNPTESDDQMFRGELFSPELIGFDGSRPPVTENITLKPVLGENLDVLSEEITGAVHHQFHPSEFEGRSFQEFTDFDFYYFRNHSGALTTNEKLIAIVGLAIIASTSNINLPRLNRQMLNVRPIMLRTAGVRVITSGQMIVIKGGSIQLDILLKTKPSTKVVVPLKVSDPKLAQISHSQLEFDYDTWDIPQTVTIHSLAGKGEEVKLIIQPCNSADESYNKIETDPVNIKISV